MKKDMPNGHCIQGKCVHKETISELVETICFLFADHDFAVYFLGGHFFAIHGEIECDLAQRAHAIAFAKDGVGQERVFETINAVARKLVARKLTAKDER